MTKKRLLLAGGGTAHLDVLRRFARQPEPAAELTLVDPESAVVHPGMAAGLVAGHYARSEACIELAPLAAAAGASFLRDRVVRVDLYARVAHLASGAVVPFDLLSLEVGALPDLSTPGAREHAIALRPFASFLSAWEALQADAAVDRVRSIAVVGNGAADVEVLLAMQYRLASDLGANAPRFLLLSDLPSLLPPHSPTVRRILGRLLVARDVVLALGSAVATVESGALITTAGRRLAADRVIWSRSSSGDPWLAASGLDCDHAGRVRINDCLQSTSHPFVLAVGDCTSRQREPDTHSDHVPRRTDSALAANLRRAVRGEPLRPSLPRRRGISLISTGDRQAVASRGPLTAAGAWVWRLKNRRDRRVLGRYRFPVAAELPTPDER